MSFTTTSRQLQGARTPQGLRRELAAVDKDLVLAFVDLGDSQQPHEAAKMDSLRRQACKTLLSLYSTNTYHHLLFPLISPTIRTPATKSRALEHPQHYKTTPHYQRALSTQICISQSSSMPMNTSNKREGRGC